MKKLSADRENLPTSPPKWGNGFEVNYLTVHKQFQEAENFLSCEHII